MHATNFTLPQHECQATRTTRRAQLEHRRHELRWIREPALPPHPEQLRPEQRLSNEAQRYIRRELQRATLNRALSLAQQRARRREWSLASYAGLGPLIRPPTQTRQRWRDDRFFAWNLVAGVDPMQIQLCEELPAGMRIPAALVEPLLPRGLSLSAAMRARRVFLVDLASLADLPCLPGRYIAAPRLLLHTSEEGALHPLAITLRPDTQPQRHPTPVFTPLDGEWDWLGARAWFQSAANHHHQAIPHLMETHFVAEVACLSMHRNLAHAHPLFALLEPHLRECVGINAEARGLLLGAEGLVDRSMSAGGRGLVELIRRAWPRWRWSAHTLEADLAGRGVGESSQLPQFPYRDDARLIHAALRRYVDDFVRVHYGDDAEVREDLELRAWLEELGDPDGGTIAGLPVLDGRTALIDFLTELLFKVTAQHSAMQYGQHEAYGFVPYCPAGLYTPPPETHGLSKAGFLAMLPDHGRALSQLAAAHILARPVTQPLGSSPSAPSSEHHARCLAALRTELELASATIRARNRQRWLPYEALMPAHIASCIDI